MIHYLFFFLLVPCLWAQNSLKASADFIRSAAALSIDYELKQKNSLTNETSSQQGHFIFDQKGHFLVSSPSMSMSADGQEYREYHPQAKQLLIKKGNSVGMANPSQIMFQYLDCKILSETKVGNFIELKLDPKGHFREIKSLVVLLNAKDFSPAKLTTTDNSDNQSEYIINKISRISHPKSTQFRFQPPKGTELVDLR